MPGDCWDSGNIDGPTEWAGYIQFADSINNEEMAQPAIFNLDVVCSVIRYALLHQNQNPQLMCWSDDCVGELTVRYPPVFDTRGGPLALILDIIDARRADDPAKIEYLRTTVQDGRKRDFGKTKQSDTNGAPRARIRIHASDGLASRNQTDSPRHVQPHSKISERRRVVGTY